MRAQTIGFLLLSLSAAESFLPELARARPPLLTVDCSAIKEKFKVCPTYSVGTVTLVRQFSLTRCLRDETWGVTGDGSQIWVKNGCRGRFSVGRGSPYKAALPDPVTCTSKDWAYQHCATPTWGQLVIVRKQLGATACKHGENWGFDFAGIWVNGNCSAAFGVE